MSRRMPPEKWEVRSVCGWPMGKKHYPICTADRRRVDGCGCGEGVWPVRYTARQWRAGRRQYRREFGRFDREFAAEMEAAHRRIQRLHRNPDFGRRLAEIRCVIEETPWTA